MKTAKVRSRTARPGFQPKRYLGLDLSGARNQKTTIAVLEYYPKEEKIFLLDIHSGIGAEKKKSGDEVLIDLVSELRTSSTVLAANVPLTFPPCSPCKRKSCSSQDKCTHPPVKWMRETVRKAARRTGSRSKPALPKTRGFTPYTQRPVELWVRYNVFPALKPDFHFDIDETLGGNRAPLTARMGYLRPRLKGVSLIEAWPKLTLAVLAEEIGLERRFMTSYRHLEKGIHSRGRLLEALADSCGIFIYERDPRKLADSLAAFDALLCAYTALLSDTGHCAKIPAGFPKNSGWVHYPALPSEAR